MHALKATLLAIVAALAPVSDTPKPEGDLYSTADLDVIAVLCAFDKAKPGDKPGTTVRCSAVYLPEGKNLGTAEGFVPESRFGHVSRDRVDGTLSAAARAMIAPLAEAPTPEM